MRGYSRQAGAICRCTHEFWGEGGGNWRYVHAHACMRARARVLEGVGLSSTCAGPLAALLMQQKHSGINPRQSMSRRARPFSAATADACPVLHAAWCRLLLNVTRAIRCVGHPTVLPLEREHVQGGPAAERAVLERVVAALGPGIPVSAGTFHAGVLSLHVWHPALGSLQPFCTAAAASIRVGRLLLCCCMPYPPTAAASYSLHSLCRVFGCCFNLEGSVACRLHRRTSCCPLERSCTTTGQSTTRRPHLTPSYLIRCGQLWLRPGTPSGAWEPHCALDAATYAWGAPTR